MNPLIIVITFVFAFFCSLFTPVFLPFAKLSYFVPFILLSLYQKKRVELLSYSFVSGLILDLLSANTPFGFWVINYWITLWLILWIKPFFFEDKFLSLPLLTFFFSIFSTLLYVLSMNLFFTKTHLNLTWFFSDLIVYPAFDFIYALVFFNLPLRYLKKLLPKKKHSVKSFKLAKD